MRNTIEFYCKCKKRTSGFFFGLRNEFFNVKVNKKWLFNRTQVTKHKKITNCSLYYGENCLKRSHRVDSSRSKRICVFMKKKLGGENIASKMHLEIEKNISQLFKTRNLSNHDFLNYI